MGFINLPLQFYYRYFVVIIPPYIGKYHSETFTLGAYLPTITLKIITCTEMCMWMALPLPSKRFRTYVLPTFCVFLR